MGLINKIKSIFKKEEVVEAKTIINNDVLTTLKETAESAKSIGMSLKEINSIVESIVFKDVVNKKYGRLVFLLERTRNKRIKKKLQKRIDKMFL